ncbi:hypothetical protein [Pseudomonas sp. KCJK8927]|uniref:hypothetical protein n=1 Tax=Pseudomonas sp. KCJK8927 TaxID=3344560 RepID=UPI003906063A
MANPNLLVRFRDEVLLAGPESSLPSNLSQFWLEELQNHLERYFDSLNSDSEGKDLDISLPLAAIIHILFAKNGGDAISESSEKLYEYFQDYRLELALEEISRKTHAAAEGATIETIFTNRDILVERSPFLQ